MTSIPDVLRRQLQQHGQEHVLAWWDDLTDDERRGLLEQVQALDLPALRKLYERRDHTYDVPPPERMEPVPVVAHDAPDNAAARRRGEEALRRGGTLRAVADSGLLDRRKRRGVRHVFYFQVDNPLVKIADPTFLGHHLTRRSEASSKVVAKRLPQEKVGMFAQVGGRCAMIEYS